MSIEYRKEFGIEWKCRYWLAVSCNSCRQCLFETLCQFEHNQEQIKKSDLLTNK